MSRILFVHHGRERFVMDDLALLLESHEVVDWHQPGRWVRVPALYQKMRSVDLVFCWFASWHAFFPVLLARQLGKPSIVVVGGYDTANVPEARYGAQRYPGPHRWVARTIIRHATHLIANSESACREAIVQARAEPNKVTKVYHGVVPISMNALIDREPIALTVGGVRRENLLRKGLLPFVQASHYLPEVRLIIVGRWYDRTGERLKEEAAHNVEFTGFVSDEELADLYRRASVYVQPSLHEGFGLSVAEAMSAGCIPVTTSAGALPEVTGGIGMTVTAPEPDTLALAIRTALDLPVETRAAAREHVCRWFPMERRQQALNSLISQVISQQGP